MSGTRAVRDPRAWLEAHINLERGVGVPSDVARITTPTRDRIEQLLNLLGRPELEFATVHLTGTNGKTSTARMAATLLHAVGMRVGLYTSPDLGRVNERILIDQEAIADDELDELLQLVALCEPSMSGSPSYFEILTAAAFRGFCDVAVDVGVIEVGLGGTWDATNSVDGHVAVVTNIALDHENFLGSTREAIAFEKSGIIKPHSHLVLGETDPDLRGIFLAREPRAVWERDRDFGIRSDRVAVGGRFVEMFTPGGSHEVFLPLHGAHQADNAVAALAAAEAFVGESLDAETVVAAFATVTSPGRMEVVGRRPLVILDGAHNVAGAQALRRALADEFSSDGPRTLVVGLLREKDPLAMLAALGLDDCSMLVVCPPPSPRALDPMSVAAAARELGFPEEQIEVADSVRSALGLAMLDTPDDGQIVVTGSLYVVGAARSKVDSPGR
jgi:dihydrofolate synthase/folylpolyglutamate synthase